ncbi:helix-turn-helix domain-containing protein [Actinacidiphila rubida]|uniref:Helix-turn-helix domain-containing protein n=1 Tax=Actinacidiphila rubida TaxID=310780 RepID=A0A1H8GRX3_9ACTN|nr:helix-turn-helix transcriptional regulator [Actinacidiphila rubida]SEN46570.1 Helix-turn-helix domain-containing protein [Actinacidiphila rubida]
MTEEGRLAGEPEEDDDMELDDDSTNGLLRSFGRQVQALRVRRGLSKAELGSALNYSESQIGSIEIGRRVMQPDVIDRADEVLDAGGVLVAMKEQVERAGFPKFFRDARKYESRAVELHAYDTQVINGLLQTEDYARTVLRMRRPRTRGDVIEQQVLSRLARQDIFERNPLPDMSFVLEEAALRRSFANPAMIQAQWQHLLDVGRESLAEIQIMPTNCAEHAGLNGAFSLMETEDGRRVGYVEVQDVSRLHTHRKRVRELDLKYGIIRAQALPPSASLDLIEQLLGER